MLAHRIVDLRACPGWADRADAVLSGAELERAQHFRRPVDRDRYVLAHVGLRLMLADVLGIPPAEIPIAAAPCLRCGGPHGRPELPPSTGRYSSLSRSGDFAAYALADEPVGVDIEVVPSIAAAREMRAALHPVERDAVDALPEIDRPLATVRCWVRKEAALKATGHGLMVDPALLAVGPGVPGPGRLRIGDRTVRSMGDLDAPAGYVAAVAIAVPARSRLIIREGSVRPGLSP